ITGEPSVSAAPRSMEYEKTVAIRSQPGPRPVEDEALRTQLITDLDKFVEKYDREEQARLRAEEQARLRKEEEGRRGGEPEPRKREESERTRDGSITTAATDPGAKRRVALDMLRKQAASQPPREN